MGVKRQDGGSHGETMSLYARAILTASVWTIARLIYLLLEGRSVPPAILETAAL